jgi:hypothetical protein
VIKEACKDEDAATRVADSTARRLGEETNVTGSESCESDDETDTLKLVAFEEQTQGLCIRGVEKPACSHSNAYGFPGFWQDSLWLLVLVKTHSL